MKLWCRISSEMSDIDQNFKVKTILVQTLFPDICVLELWNFVSSLIVISYKLISEIGDLDLI